MGPDQSLPTVLLRAKIPWTSGEKRYGLLTFTLLTLVCLSVARRKCGQSLPSPCPVCKLAAQGHLCRAVQVPSCAALTCSSCWGPWKGPRLAGPSEDTSLLFMSRQPLFICGSF